MKSIRKLTILLMAAAMVAIMAVGCDTQATDQASEGTDARADWPDKLVITLIPSEDQATVTRRYEPLAEYLGKQLDLEVEIFFPQSYTASIEAMRSDRVDIGFFGPFAYILAAERADAIAFAVPNDFGEQPVYHSAFIALEESGIRELSDLEGRRVAFADPASTSGHLFPRAMIINELGIPNDEIEDYFGEVTFSGAHQASVQAVLNGDVDAAPISSGSGYNVIENSDHPNIGQLNIVARTGDIPSSVFALRGGLPEELQARIRGAFYDAVNHPELEEFLDEIGTAGYIHAFDHDYDIIRDTASALEMSPEELF